MPVDSQPRRFAHACVGVIVAVLLRASACVADDPATASPSTPLEQHVARTFGDGGATTPEELDYVALPKEMTLAGAELKSRQTVVALERQRQILRTIDRWLQSATPQAGSPSADPEVGGVGPEPSQDPGDERGPSGDGAARESTPGGHGTRPTVVQLERRRNLATAVWGHLPDREREQMLQAYPDDYLPEYEDLVERYYEALAAERLTGERTRPFDAP